MHVDENDVLMFAFSREDMRDPALIIVPCIEVIFDDIELLFITGFFLKSSKLFNFFPIIRFQFIIFDELTHQFKGFFSFITTWSNPRSNQCIQFLDSIDIIFWIVMRTWIVNVSFIFV